MYARALNSVNNTKRKSIPKKIDNSIANNSINVNEYLDDMNRIDLSNKELIQQAISLSNLVRSISNIDIENHDEEKKKLIEDTATQTSTTESITSTKSEKFVTPLRKKVVRKKIQES